MAEIHHHTSFYLGNMQCPTTIYKFTRHRWIFGKDTSFGSLQINISISSHNEGEEQNGEAQQELL